MLTLGIDPGTAITGYGLVEMTGNKLQYHVCGCINTPAGMAMPERLQMLSGELKALIDKYHPDEIAVEELFFNKNTRTAVSVAQARGVILLSGAEMGLAIGEYTPPQIKLAVTGYGKADKKQMQKMVQTLLNLDKIPKPDDAADALAVAICHLHHCR
ncbi:MAG: crossover junction endodeoxyribonuclease RuvC [Candidatus Margulisiibacteriota bacterium]